MNDESRGRSKRKWIKLYCYGILHGSISYQLSEVEQSCWVKLLCLAGLIGREGQISDNDGRALPHEFIAHELHTSLSVLGVTLKKCQEEGRLTEDESGIHITNWKSYQSEYDRQKPYRLKAQLEASQGEKNIYTVYSEEIGELSHFISENLKDLETQYSQEDIIDAIREAARGNVRKLVYIEKILENWAREGKSAGGGKGEFEEVDAGDLKTDPAAGEIWAKALGQIELETTKTNFRTWYQKTQAISYRDGVFAVGVPSAFIAEYLGRNQRSLIEKALGSVTSPGVRVVFKVVKSAEP